MPSEFEEGFVDFTHATRYRVLRPDGDAAGQPRPVLVALHGMGMNAEKFQRVMRHLELSEMLLVLPEGMYPYEMRQDPPKAGAERVTGHAWYIYNGDQEEFFEHLVRSEAHVLRVLDKVEERYAVDRSRSVVLGFSQGGYLAGFTALRNPDRFAGLVLASSRLKHEFLEQELESRTPPPSLFLHSERDRAIPWPAAEKTLEVLRAAGGDVSQYLHEDGHRLPPDAVVKLGEWLGLRGFDAGRAAAAQVQQAWKAVERGEADRALEFLASPGVDCQDSEVKLVTAVAHQDLEDYEEARKILEALSTEELDGDSEYMRRFYLGQTLYHLGRPQESLDLLFALEPGDPIERANLEWWKGLCYDHLGKQLRADECFASAKGLDPEGAPQPVPIALDEVERVVAEAAQELPESVRKLFEQVPVVIQDLPPRDVIRTSQGRIHPDALGLYSGNSLIDSSVFDGIEYPATIFIYRRNLERFCRSPEDVRKEIRITLLHELGHHLGYDEDGLEGLGLA